MSKFIVLVRVSVVALALTACGSAATCPAGYARVGDLCMQVAADDGGVADAGWTTDGALPDTDAGVVEDGGTVVMLDDGGAAEDAATPVEDACVAHDETCNGLDDDCDGAVDEALKPAFFYADADGDGHGDPSTLGMGCSVPAGAVALGDDCDDTCPTCFPGASEVCNGVDEDCVLGADNGALLAFYADADGDGYGNAATVTTACAPPVGFVAVAGDCDDGSAAIHPGAPEVCNLIDDNCTGGVDEGLPITTYYADADGDGFAPSGAATRDACAPVAGYTSRAPVTGSTDCADGDPRAYPGQTSYFTGEVVGRPGNRDFNCSVSLEPQYPGGGFCSGSAIDCRGATGFIGIQPLCGTAAATYQTSCGVQFVSGTLSCVGTTDHRAQGCR